MTRVLLVGGTAEARALAQALVDADVEVVSSLAGRVSRPRLPAGEVRIGGFGGVEGLVAAIEEGGFTHVVDATHPFAATMTQHVVEATGRLGVPAVRLSRPGWSGRPDAAGWRWVSSHDEAREVAESLGDRPFLTTGRQTLPAYAAWSPRPVLVRVVEPPEQPLPAAWRVLLDRGPYERAGERDLMREHGVDVLLTKDSGGAYTSAKLDAAADLGVPVVVVARPPVPGDIAVVGDVEGVLSALGLEGAPPDPARG